VTTEEIERMLKDASKEYLKAKPTELKRLGIDEIALIKGKENYCAVLIDLEKSKLIGIGSIPILQVCKSMIKSIAFWKNLHLASQKNLF
jgi:hypothetical protein